MSCSQYIVDHTFHQFMMGQGLQIAAPSFAVGVSGGVDSMALVLAAHRWTQVHGGSVAALTVDHCLREGSDAEALQVAQWMKDLGVPHHILTWTHGEVSSRIQTTARKARYDLLSSWCRDHNVAYLMTAHHREDQEETFFMRLVKGSGLDGLSSMRARTLRDGITHLRPFLQLSKVDLESYLRASNCPHLKDPSNENPTFTRVRFRTFLESEGLSHTRFDGVIEKLQEDRDFFDDLCNTWWHENVSGVEPFYVHVERLQDLTSLHPAYGKRCLVRLLKAINGLVYPVGSESLDRLWQALQDPQFKAITVGNCYLMARKGGLHIQREFERIVDEISLENQDVDLLWDDRISLQNYGSVGVVKRLGRDLIPPLKKTLGDTSLIPSVVWPTLPAVFVEGALKSVPALNYGV